VRQGAARAVEQGARFLAEPPGALRGSRGGEAFRAAAHFGGTRHTQILFHPRAPRGDGLHERAGLAPGRFGGRLIRVRSQARRLSGLALRMHARLRGIACPGVGFGARLQRRLRLPLCFSAFQGERGRPFGARRACGGGFRQPAVGFQQTLAGRHGRHDRGGLGFGRLGRFALGERGGLGRGVQALFRFDARLCGAPGLGFGALARLQSFQRLVFGLHALGAFGRQPALLLQLGFGDAPQLALGLRARLGGGEGFGIRRGAGARVLRRLLVGGGTGAGIGGRFLFRLLAGFGRQTRGAFRFGAFLGCADGGFVRLGAHLRFHHGYGFGAGALRGFFLGLLLRLGAHFGGGRGFGFLGGARLRGFRRGAFLLGAPLRFLDRRALRFEACGRGGLQFRFGPGTGLRRFFGGAFGREARFGFGLGLRFGLCPGARLFRSLGFGGQARFGQALQFGGLAQPRFLGRAQGRFAGSGAFQGFEGFGFGLGPRLRFGFGFGFGLGAGEGHLFGQRLGCQTGGGRCLGRFFRGGSF